MSDFKNNFISLNTYKRLVPDIYWPRWTIALSPTSVAKLISSFQLLTYTFIYLYLTILDLNNY